MHSRKMKEIERECDLLAAMMQHSEREGECGLRKHCADTAGGYNDKYLDSCDKNIKYSYKHP